MSTAPITENGASAIQEGREREPKRRRSAPLPLDLGVAAEVKPEKIVDVVPDGDVLLVVSGCNGDQQAMGLRCSSFALSMASPVFKSSLDTPSPTPPPATDSNASSFLEPTGKILQLAAEDGDALLLIVYIFHFRHDLQPAHVSADLLLRMGVVATKYQCIVAVSRATASWFKHNFALNKPADTLKLVQAAYLLDDAESFACFTRRAVTSTPANAKLTLPYQDGVQRISTALQACRIEALTAIRTDIDILVAPIADVLAEGSKHYCDCPPDDEPDPADYPPGPNGKPGEPTPCVVDREGAPLFLGELRDAEIWPSTAWGTCTVEGLIQHIREFEAPDYDDSDKCVFCFPLTEVFDEKLKLVRNMQNQRLWGLCLDCFKAGGVHKGKCRCTHAKASVPMPASLD